MPWKQPAGRFVSAAASRAAPKLRRMVTEGERILWKALRDEVEISGSHFRRQVAIGPYVVDFCCLKLRVVIEVDGKIHETDAARKSDAERETYLRAEGFRVLRLSNNEVLLRRPAALHKVRTVLAGATPTPSPSPQGGGEPRGASV